jgi:uncharacterized membrane protein
MEGMFTTVHNSNKKKSDVSLGEQVIACTITMIAAIIARALGAPDKWLAAIFVTVVTFAGMLSYFRESWASKQFWTIMACAFLLHLLLIWMIFRVALRRKEDIGLLICLPGILLECFLLYHAVKFFQRQTEES